MDYYKALQKAVEYMEKHLEEDLTTAEVAREAGYSLYHLTRVFSAVLGEPMGSYLTKLRLAVAARQLVHSNRQVLEIALSSGYSSAEAFTRAFRGAYGITPTAYRKNGVDLYYGAKKELDDRFLQHLVSGGVTQTPVVREISPFYVVGMRTQTSVLDNCLPELWTRFEARVKELPALRGRTRFGVCETGRDATRFTPEGDVVFTELAGVSYHPGDVPPPGMAIKSVPGGRYAVFTHTGSVSELKHTYDYIWGSWVLRTKETLRNSVDFERYGVRFLTGDSPEIELYIPLEDNPA